MADGPDQPVYLLTGSDRPKIQLALERLRRHFAPEAVETVVAAVSEARARLIAEAADLIYHLLVVLEARGIALAEVEAQLAERTRRSGLEEKASRPSKPRPARARNR